MFFGLFHVPFWSNIAKITSTGVASQAVVFVFFPPRATTTAGRHRNTQLTTHLLTIAALQPPVVAM
jgi:hypothetical protein